MPRPLPLLLLLLVAVFFLSSTIRLGGAHEHDDEEDESSCEQSPDVRVDAEFRPGIVTVDGRAEDWADVDGPQLALLPALDFDEDKAYGGGLMTVKVKAFVFLTIRFTVVFLIFRFFSWINRGRAGNPPSWHRPVVQELDVGGNPNSISGWPRRCWPRSFTPSPLIPPSKQPRGHPRMIGIEPSHAGSQATTKRTRTFLVLEGRPELCISAMSPWFPYGREH
ncbi:hypothetical protein B296_00047116 [Ensete ventricosum]|uniref:Uncharacterized protein n=1 Tax=Ensete ventricosum TaxID=4639 RepID=A0A426Z101_ENSVE|nr:hypothetical protein B296_00047116 [Ensete ventricosum]